VFISVLEDLVPVDSGDEVIVELILDGDFDFYFTFYFDFSWVVTSIFGMTMGPGP
jgi:hypothetical protein